LTGVNRPTTQEGTCGMSPINKHNYSANHFYPVQSDEKNNNDVINNSNLYHENKQKVCSLDLDLCFFLESTLSFDELFDVKLLIANRYDALARFQKSGKPWSNNDPAIQRGEYEFNRFINSCLECVADVVEMENAIAKGNEVLHGCKKSIIDEIGKIAMETAWVDINFFNDGDVNSRKKIAECLETMRDIRKKCSNMLNEACKFIQFPRMATGSKRLKPTKDYKNELETMFQALKEKSQSPDNFVDDGWYTITNTLPGKYYKEKESRLVLTVTERRMTTIDDCL
jgi:hypothetical protein